MYRFGDDEICRCVELDTAIMLMSFARAVPKQTSIVIADRCLSRLLFKSIDVI